MHITHPQVFVTLVGSAVLLCAVLMGFGARKTWHIARTTQSIMIRKVCFGLTIVQGAGLAIWLVTALTLLERALFPH